MQDGSYIPTLFYVMLQFWILITSAVIHGFISTGQETKNWMKMMIDQLNERKSPVLLLYQDEGIW